MGVALVTVEEPKEVVELVVPRPPGARPTLAGQFLALQVTVLLVALAVASVVALRQGEADFRDERGAPLRAAAQDLANLDVVRAAGRHAHRCRRRCRRTRSSSRTGSTPRPCRWPISTAQVLFGAAPDDAGQRMPLRTEPADRVTTWTGDLDVDGEHSIAVQVPVYAPDEDGEPPRQVGIVMVADVYPSVADRAEELLPDLVTFLGIGLGLGLLGRLAAGPADQAAHPGTGARRDRGARRPARGAAALDPRGRRRGGHRRHGHGPQRQRARARRAAGDGAWAAGSTSSTSNPGCARPWSATTRCRTGCWCSGSGWWCSTATGWSTAAARSAR